MRGTWGIVALLLVGTGMACHDKPKRVLRPPETQIWDLPPLADDKLSRPPTYPEEKRPGLEAQQQQNNQVPGLGGPRGSGGSPGGQSGPGGPGSGSFGGGGSPYGR